MENGPAAPAACPPAPIRIALEFYPGPSRDAKSQILGRFRTCLSQTGAKSTEDLDLRVPAACQRRKHAGWSVFFLLVPRCARRAPVGIPSGAAGSKRLSEGATLQIWSRETWQASQGCKSEVLRMSGKGDQPWRTGWATNPRELAGRLTQENWLGNNPKELFAE